MAFWASDYVLQGGLERIAEADRLFVCSGQPTSYQEASSDLMLAQKAVVPGDGNGSFTIEDGDSTGRKVTVSAQSISAASASGTGDHVALADSANARVLWVAPLASSVAIVSGNPVNVPAFKVTAPDPA